MGREAKVDTSGGGMDIRFEERESSCIVSMVRKARVSKLEKGAGGTRHRRRRGVVRDEKVGAW